MFGTSAINAKILRAATLKSFETWSYSCTKSTVQAWETNAIYSSTTWKVQPTWKSQLDSVSAASGRDGCTPGGSWVSFDVLAAVQHSQAAGGYNTTIGLRASSETGEAGWKRFRNNATLSIEYNSRPGTPTSLKTTYPSSSCVTGAGRPSLPRVDPPILNATIKDADGVKGQTVQGKFEIWNLAHSSMVHSFYTPSKKPGGLYVDSVPTLADGSYAWRVLGYDNMNYSAWSQWCEFTVDGTRPAQPSLESVPTAGYCTADAGVGDSNTDAACAVGQTSKFRVTPPDSGVTKYKWSVNATLPTSAFIPIATRDFTISHSTFGPETVRVWTYDAAGNISTGPGELEYRVSGAARSGWWRMDDVGATLTDASGRNRPMTMVGGYTRVAGTFAPPADSEPSEFYDPTDFATKFNGSTAQATTASPVLTMGSGYTLSAWVRLDSPVTTRGIIVSQDRGTAATSAWSASLFADPPSTLNASDPTSCACPGGRIGFATFDGVKNSEYVYADTTLVPGRWTHVVAVYSPAEPSMSLYVDGDLVDSRGDAGTASQTSSTLAGPLRVGHLNNYPTGWFPGVIDEVGTFDGAFDDVQAQELYTTVRLAPAS